MSQALRPAAHAEIRVLDDPAPVAAAVLAAAAAASASIVLAGGSTPRAAYERAAAIPGDWSSASFWLGDERCVREAHADANAALVRDALLRDRPACLASLRRPPGELGAAAAAEAYERELRAAFPGHGAPAFDLAILGLGPDVHTASLFPHDAALRERERWAAPVAAPPLEPKVPRVTLTLPALAAARKVVFLVTGAAKAAAVARAFAGHPGPDAPASLLAALRPVEILLDHAAAQDLP